MNVERILTKCRFLRRHQGFHALLECINIALEDEKRLIYMMGIYCDVVKVFKSS